MACLLPTGRRGECGVRERVFLFFAYGANYTSHNIFRRKSVTYIIYVYTLILMKKGASSGAFTVSSLPTMSTTSSALSFSSSIIVVNLQKKKKHSSLAFPSTISTIQERHPLLTVHLDNAFKHYKCHFSQPPSMDKHYDRLSYLTDARNLWMET